MARKLLWAYAMVAVLTLIFQIWVRSGMWRRLRNELRQGYRMGNYLARVLGRILSAMVAVIRSRCAAYRRALRGPAVAASAVNE